MVPSPCICMYVCPHARRVGHPHAPPPPTTTPTPTDLGAPEPAGGAGLLPRRHAPRHRLGAGHRHPGLQVRVFDPSIHSIPIDLPIPTHRHTPEPQQRSHRRAAPHAPSGPVPLHAALPRLQPRRHAPGRLGGQGHRARLPALRVGRYVRARVWVCRRRRPTFKASPHDPTIYTNHHDPQATALPPPPPLQASPPPAPPTAQPPPNPPA